MDDSCQGNLYHPGTLPLISPGVSSTSPHSLHHLQQSRNKTSTPLPRSPSPARPPGNPTPSSSPSNSASGWNPSPSATPRYAAPSPTCQGRLLRRRRRNGVLELGRHFTARWVLDEGSIGREEGGFDVGFWAAVKARGEVGVVLGAFEGLGNGGLSNCETLDTGACFCADVQL